MQHDSDQAWRPLDPDVRTGIPAFAEQRAKNPLSGLSAWRKPQKRTAQLPALFDKKSPPPMAMRAKRP